MAMKHYFVAVEQKIDVSNCTKSERRTSFFFCEPCDLEGEIYHRYGGVFKYEIISITAL